MNRLALRVAAAAVAAGLGLLAVPAAASASPTAPTPVRIGTPALHPIDRPDSHYNQNGFNWSGYVARNRTFTSVSAGWTEPAVTCNSTNDLFAPWVGIDGFATQTVEQTGVATNCSSGHPVYAGWYEMYPAGPVYYSNAVSAGDKITASVKRSGNVYTLTLKDLSKGWTKTTHKTLSAGNASAEVIMESPTGAYPNFHKVTFTNSTVNGSPLANFSPVALDASNNGGFEDHTGPLSGGRFSITYLRE